MVSFSSDVLQALIVSMIFPLTRVLGVITAAPILNHTSIPNRVKLGLGIMITLVISPTITALPNIQIFSFQGLMILIEQLVIGLAMGFSMRIVFSAIELAGFLIGTTMGLGFASFYDPMSQGQSMALNQFLMLLSMMVFLSMDGHLVMISTIADSFVWLPLTLEGIGIRPMNIAKWGADIFSAGLLLALPALAALLMVNMAMGILTKTAPQLNLFGIGFPITITVGFIVVALTLPNMLKPLENMIQTGFTHMHQTSGMSN
jgi:flagellar biosynthesis protein FliR